METLPKDVLVSKIALLLPPYDVINIMLTNKELRVKIDHRDFWLKKLEKDFPGYFSYLQSFTKISKPKETYVRRFTELSKEIEDFVKGSKFDGSNKVRATEFPQKFYDYNSVFDLYEENVKRDLDSIQIEDKKLEKFIIRIVSDDEKFRAAIRK